MGGRYHQNYYMCEMNRHKYKGFITNTNDSRGHVTGQDEK